MKKVILLALLVLGTTAMVNAQTAPAKKPEAKEVKMGKHKKHHRNGTKKAESKMETKKEETPKK